MYLAEEDVEDHHKEETDGKTDCAHIGVCAFLGFGYQFFDYYVHHRTGSKSKEIGENGNDKGGKEDCKDCSYGFYHTAEGAHKERFTL